jgi:hypothetical protein
VATATQTFSRPITLTNPDGRVTTAQEVETIVVIVTASAGGAIETGTAQGSNGREFHPASQSSLGNSDRRAMGWRLTHSVVIITITATDPAATGPADGGIVYVTQTLSGETTDATGGESFVIQVGVNHPSSSV